VVSTAALQCFCMQGFQDLVESAAQEDRQEGVGLLSIRGCMPSHVSPNTRLGTEAVIVANDIISVFQLLATPGCTAQGCRTYLFGSSMHRRTHRTHWNGMWMHSWLCFDKP
jgi:hypothetical protein